MSVNPSDYGDGDEDFDLPPAGEDGGSKYDFPEGDYSIVLVGMEKKDSQAGNPMIVWTFKGDKDAGLPTGTYMLFTAMTPKAMFKVHEVSVALGLRDPSDTTSTVKVKKKDAIGRRCMGSFKKETYQGKTATKLQRVQAHPQGFGPVELTPDDLPF